VFLASTGGADAGLSSVLENYSNKTYVNAWPADIYKAGHSAGQRLPQPGDGSTTMSPGTAPRSNPTAPRIAQRTSPVIVTAFSFKNHFEAEG